MWIEAVFGGDHSPDGRYQRRRENKKIVKSPTLPEEISTHLIMHPALANSDTRVLVDEAHHVLMVEFVDRSTGAVVDSLSAQDLERHDHHGILVDVAT